MKLPFIFVFFGILYSSSFAQNFTIGTENGINFSNLHSDLSNGKWNAQPGPINGIFASYHLGNWFVLQSGINHTSFYFGQSNINRYYPEYYRSYSSSSFIDFALSSSILYPSGYGSNQTKFGFLRFPFLIKFKTPGKINFEIGGGTYFAFLTNDEYRGKDKEFYTEEYRDENFPSMNDWGWILATSANYSISNRWSLFVAGQVTTGKEKYMEGKMGSTELTFGIGYKPFATQKQLPVNDSLGRKIKIIPHVGVNISNTGSTENKNEYNSAVGFSSGVSLVFELAQDVAILSGAWYERKGYGLNYTGNFNFIYKPPLPFENQNVSKMVSEVCLDYITFPFMFEFSFGKKVKSNFNLGAYFSLLQNAFAQGEKIDTNNYGQGFQVTKNYFNESLDNWFRKNDAGFVFGYRIDVPVFNRGSVFLAANQSFGVVDIFKNLDEITVTQPFYINEEMHNNSTSLWIGLSIPVSQK